MSRTASTTPRRATALLLALLTGMLLAGCGGTSARRAGESSSQAGATSSTPIGHETYKDVVAAVAACKQGVDTATWLSAPNKEALYGVCNHGLRRGLTEVKQYGLEVCAEVSYTSPAKSPAEKSRVFAACYSGTKQKTAAVG